MQIEEFKERSLDDIIDSVAKQERTDDYIGKFFIPNYTPMMLRDYETRGLVDIIRGYNVSGVMNDELDEYLKTLKTNDYLTTLYWKTVSQWKKDVEYGRCEICGKETTISTHHKTWKHKGHELQYLDELYCCCNDCFKKIYAK